VSILPLDPETERALARICRRRHVRRLALFGSALRDDFDDERSDLDFVVEFAHPDPLQRGRDYWSLREDLERLFVRNVDLVNPRYLRNPFLRAEVERDQRALYDAA